jgi:hypothetical protein
VKDAPANRDEGPPSPEMLAAKLCAAVYLNGKVDGRFQMPLDYLRVKTGLTPTAIAIGLSLAELHDWVGLTRRVVALKAAGIYVAKGVLGLSR